MGESFGRFFIKGIVKFILIIILAIVIALGSIILFSFTSNWLSGYREYIFYIIPTSSLFIALGVIYFWFFVFFYRIIYKRQMKKLTAEKILTIYLMKLQMLKLIVLD